jgi:hypothetical protein
MRSLGIAARLGSKLRAGDACMVHVPPPGRPPQPGARAVVYIIRVSKSVPVKPSMVWPGLEAEDEYIFLNRVPLGAIVQMIPVTRIPAIVVDGGLLKPFP